MRSPWVVFPFVCVLPPFFFHFTLFYPLYSTMLGLSCRAHRLDFGRGLKVCGGLYRSSARPQQTACSDNMTMFPNWTGCPEIFHVAYVTY